MTQALATINFHGNDLYLVEHNAEPFTPMKPIVEGMGLAWKPQYQKLNDNNARWGVTILVIPTQSGSQQAVCMPLRKLPAFFASISANKVRADLRATIILFQNECDDALWRYWMEKKVRPQLEATVEQLALPRLSLPSDPERKALNKLVKVWGGMIGGNQGETMPRINTQVAAHFGRTTVDDMTVEEIKSAIIWVQAKIDALQMPQAMPTSPQAALEIPGSNRLNELYFDIRRHIRNIEDNMTEIQGIVDRASMPRRGWGAFHHALVGNNQEAGRKAITSMICMLDGVYANVRSTMIACGM